MRGGYPEAMADSFDVTVRIDKPIEEIFDFLADGENDPKFSPRVLKIEKTNPGAPGKGAIYASTVKDAGMKTKREFELTEFERPTKIRWRELSDNMVVVPAGGYDLVPDGDGTKLTLFNELEGHGFGKLIAGFALRSGRKSADGMVGRIKEVVEAA
jgi:carbon monoxide dehydrogenase subunit G